MTVEAGETEALAGPYGVKPTMNRHTLQHKQNLSKLQRNAIKPSIPARPRQY